jgi:hypothetical protein
MQNLLNAGLNTPNIIADYNLVYGVDFQLSEEWTTLQTDLGFSSTEQVYLLWLWMYYNYNNVYTYQDNRTPA